MIAFTKKTLVLMLLIIAVSGFSGCFWTQTTTTAEITTTVSTVSTTYTAETTTTDTLTTAAPTTPVTTVTTTIPITTTFSSTTTYTTTVTTVVSETTSATTEPTTTSVPTTIQVSLSVTPPTKTEYEIGEQIDYTGMIVLYTDTYGVETEVDLRDCLIETDALDTYGQKGVNVSYMDIRVEFSVMFRLPAYYLVAENKSGETLKAALNEILNSGLTRVSYGESRYILDETDQDPLNPVNLILVYLGTSVSGVWDVGATWNREHVWPQSLLGGIDTENTDVGVGSDLHNLKPANPGENSRRGNKYFANEPWPYTIGYPSYCPRPEVRGDIARILFYMVVMYEDAPLDLELVDAPPAGYQMAMLSILLEWHELDPVDDFERNRNEVIYLYQSNRNPFIDYPEFVDLIWGN